MEWQRLKELGDGMCSSRVRWHMIPMPYRFLTSLAVRLQGQLSIFHAGEGCQINLKETKLGIKTLRVLAFSHLHGDHCLGAPALVMMRARVPNPGPLVLKVLSGRSV